MPKPNLYVLQVKGGSEDRMRVWLLEELPGIVQDCYVPEYETMMAQRGAWHKTRARLFPGYLFIKTSDPAAFCREISHLSQFARLLGTDGTYFMPLTEHEVAWLQLYTKPGTFLVEMSRGVIEGDRVIVTSGPLKGHEAEIAKIDRHKRQAVLNVCMFNQVKQVKVGLEIVWKK